MRLETNISAQILYLYEMEDIVIVAENSEETKIPVPIVLRSSGQTILDESYWFDFSGRISLHIKDVIENMFSISLPDVGEEIHFASIFLNFELDVNDSELDLEFQVCSLSSQSLEKMSDIDVLRIPEDYVMPLCRCAHLPGSGVDIVTPYRRYSKPSWLSVSGTDGNSALRLVDLSYFPHEIVRSFHVELSGTNPVICSPQFKVCAGHFEQYLFSNRYGGFDNVAMSGSLQLEAETEHETGVYSGHLQPISADLQPLWTQHSGYVSWRTVLAMRDLICSRDIYHLNEGKLKKIVITESSLSLSSDETVHSFSFKYRYAED